MSLRSLLVVGGPPLAAAVVGGLGSRRAPEVYGRLAKPRWAPPAQAFGPVWTALYVSIGVVGGRMHRRGAAPRTWALHGTQLALNAAWPATFFGIRDRRAALGVIAALDAVLVAEVADLARRDPVAAATLGPYLGWCLFATALTARVGDPGPAGGAPGVV
ncbi:TspO/MBR family protein [Modestobacter sp. NPDC049651]|uniref:TspO/MBR family protein n=1 Tax=unclassified Modestobacter TaxID=2643866 RepID=UPI0033C6E669